MSGINVLKRFSSFITLQLFNIPKAYCSPLEADVLMVHDQNIEKEKKRQLLRDELFFKSNQVYEDKKNKEIEVFTELFVKKMKDELKEENIREYASKGEQKASWKFSYPSSFETWTRKIPTVMWHSDAKDTLETIVEEKVGELLEGTGINYYVAVGCCRKQYRCQNSPIYIHVIINWDNNKQKS